MDEDQHVVGVAGRQGLEAGAVCRTWVRGTPRIQWIPDVAHRREAFQDPGAGGVRDGRQIHARPWRHVCDERGLARGDGDDPGPPPADAATGPTHALHELRGLQQLVQVGAADHPGGVQRGVRHPGLAGERSGMGDRRGLRLVAASDLDRHDRLAELERAIGKCQKPLRPLEPLHEQDDRACLRVVQAVSEVVAQVQDHLRATADDPAEADPRPRMHERVRHRARLRDAGDAASGQVR